MRTIRSSATSSRASALFLVISSGAKRSREIWPRTRHVLSSRINRGICSAGSQDVHVCEASIPTVAEVPPIRVCLLDQPELFCSGPVFNLFFSGACTVNVAERFQVDQRIDPVTEREALDLARSMLLDSSFDIVGEPDVQGARLVRHDVDIVGLAPGHDSIIGGGLIRGQIPPLRPAARTSGRNDKADLSVLAPPLAAQQIAERACLLYNRRRK